MSLIHIENIWRRYDIGTYNRIKQQIIVFLCHNDFLLTIIKCS